MLKKQKLYSKLGIFILLAAFAMGCNAQSAKQPECGQETQPVQGLTPVDPVWLTDENGLITLKSLATERDNKYRMYVVLDNPAPDKDYGWRYRMSQSGIIKEVPADVTLITGCRIWAFEGVSEGRMELKFFSYNPDNPTAPPVNFADYTVKVNPDKTIEIMNFYTEYNDINGPGNPSALITLPRLDADMDKSWSYRPSREGIIEQGEWSDYAGRPMENEDALMTIPDSPLPGTFAFVFKGVKPGDVDLFFSYGNPDDAAADDTARFKIRVYEDKSLYVIGHSRDWYK